MSLRPGEYPPQFIRPDGSVDETGATARERRHWRTIFGEFWSSIPPWLQIALVSGLTSSGFVAFGGSKTHSDEVTMRRVFREELAPMKAGFEAFVAKAPKDTRLDVLTAMSQAEDRIKERRNGL